MIKFFRKQDAATPAEAGAAGGGQSAEQENETTKPQGEQTEDANISILADSNNQNHATESKKEDDEAWKGDERFFQTGKKAGQLRPTYRRIGETLPREAGGVDTQPKPGDFEGIKLDPSATAKPASAPAAAAQDKATKATKAEKKLIEAKIGAKMVMRMLDTLTGFISGGEYGKDFTQPQIKDRMTYREELEKDWADYLQTLDYTIHPGLVVAFGSMMYIAPAFETPKGKERTKTIKEKVLGKLFSKLF